MTSQKQFMIVRIVPIIEKRKKERLSKKQVEFPTISSNEIWFKPNRAKHMKTKLPWRCGTWCRTLLRHPPPAAASPLHVTCLETEKQPSPERHGDESPLSPGKRKMFVARADPAFIPECTFPTAHLCHTLIYDKVEQGLRLPKRGHGRSRKTMLLMAG